jgi:hypothetical protein
MAQFVTRCAKPDLWRGSREAVLWGMPDPNVFEAIDAGDIDIEIGGCIISEEEPKYRCRECGSSFGHDRSGNEPEPNDLVDGVEETR